MINIQQAEKYCNNYTKIENYYLAVNDKTQTWHCHHCNEILADGTVHSVKYLKDNDLYYNRPANELIFLTNSEHIKLHSTGEKNNMYGRKQSEETRKKQSEAHKGRKQSEEHRRKNAEAHKGRIISEETRQKISKSNKGKKLTEETRQKISEAFKGSNSPTAKQCTINGKTYGCIKDAWLNICPDTKYSTFYNRLKNNYYN